MLRLWEACDNLLFPVPMETAKGPFVFAVDNDIYVSPNVQRPPTSTELQHLDVIFSDPLMPNDAMHLRYASNRFPYLAFTLPHARYQATILKPLAYTKYTLPIKMIGGQYCLEPKVAESWRELELNLRLLASKLFDRYCPWMPVEFEVFPFPGDYGYDKGRHTEDWMRRGAMRARKAFAPLMAMCSFAIAMTPNFTEEAPAWVEYLSKNGAHPRWLQELRRTSIVNLAKGIGRVGCVLRPNPACQFMERIPKFILANVPVWLIWNNPKDYHGTSCAQYRPSQQAVQDAQRRPHQGAACVAAAPRLFLHDNQPSPIEQHHETHIHTHHVATFPSTPDIEEPPLPEPHCGQIRGETVHEFMERRAQMNSQRERKETPDERRSRTQKIAAAEAYALPGRQGARVYEWVAHGKHWIRTALTRGYVEQQWELMAPGHLRYDSFRNEWDYCELFDPAAEATIDDDYDDLARDYLQGPDSSNEASPETPRSRRVIDGVAPRDSPFGTKNLDQEYVDAQSASELTKPEALDIVLGSRYGFCGASGPEVPDAASWHYTRKTLSDTESAWTWPEYQGQVHHFVRKVVLNDVPPHIWDLDPASARPVMFFNSDIVVERVTTGPRVFYRIVPLHPPAGEAPQWDLVVPDAITAVECLRRSHPTLGKAGLVQFFSQTGRPFFTRMPVHPQPTPARVPHFLSSFAERHHEYSPDPLDYKGYERDRAVFLQSDRARAAIKEGGIVWRLAVDHLRLADVMAGPVDLPSAVYERFDGEAVGSCDDELTTDELNLMCGVYRIFTRQYQLATIQILRLLTLRCRSGSLSKS